MYDVNASFDVKITVSALFISKNTKIKFLGCQIFIMMEISKKFDEYKKNIKIWHKRWNLGYS